MSGTASAETVSIEVVQVGQGKSALVLPADCKWQDVIDAIGGTGKKLTNRGEDLQAKAAEPVQADSTVTVGPRTVKQG